MRFDPYCNPYPSRRNVRYAARAMVCASHPLAARAGMELIERGGNAVDAALAAAAALTVVEPCSNGIGSDVFALVWKDGALRCLNGSGPSPAALGGAALAAIVGAAAGVGSGRGDALGGGARGGALGIGAAAGSPARLPAYGWAPVTVPGAPAAWAELARSCGKLGLEEDLAPAIRLASEGHAVSLGAAYYWAKAFDRYKAGLPGVEPGLLSEWFRVFAPRGRAPSPGETWRSPDHAATLRSIARSGAEDFYRGAIAGRLVESSARGGGLFEASDLASFKPEWVQPVSAAYKGFEVWEAPPNCQGIAALSALGALSGLELEGHDDPRSIHLQLEAMKLAFADAHAHIADPTRSADPSGWMLDPEYLSRRASSIGERAEERGAGRPLPGGTVYLCAADGDGTMVSYIQSNYMGFGSGIVVPGTGVALNNRGHCFVVDDAHPNAAGPGKRPYNTIMPGFLTRGGLPVGPFGVMGGHMQPQGHVQVVVNSIDFGMNPQQALDAPRWQWLGGLEVELEPGFGEGARAELERRGHAARFQPELGGFGRGQIIWRHEHGYVGATESRTDGSIEAL